MDSLFYLHDVHFSLAVRLRLGITPYDDVVRCVCGASLVESPLHFQSCRHLSGTRIIRHDRLVQVLARISRLCGVVVQIEPRVDGDDKSRTDGNLYFHSQTHNFDVSVVDPGAKTYVRAAQRPLGAAGVIEKSKNDQYANRCREQGSLFSPVVLECFGALGVRCRDLCSKIEEEGSLNGVKSIHGIKIKSYLLKALSFSLQYGNGLLVMDGSKKARARL